MPSAAGGPTKHRILVVEDEPKVARALKEGLSSEGCEVTLATSGEEGIKRATSQAFDLLILDRTLPGLDGLEVLFALRSRGVRCPALLLTAHDATGDRLAGRDAGASDYLVKPFAFSELRARVLGLLRGRLAETARQLAVADLVIDVATRVVTRAGRALALSPPEYEILEYLVRHQGTPVSREMLAADVWRETQRGTPVDDVIDVHMARLSRRVDDGFATRLIHSVRGVGFVIREGEEW